MVTRDIDSYNNVINEKWDSDPSTLRAWIDDLEQTVSRTHPEWILLATQGVVLLRNNKTGVSSSIHAEVPF